MLRIAPSSAIAFRFWSQWLFPISKKKSPGRKKFCSLINSSLKQHLFWGPLITLLSEKSRKIGETLDVLYGTQREAKHFFIQKPVFYHKSPEIIKSPSYVLCKKREMFEIVCVIFAVLNKVWKNVKSVRHFLLFSKQNCLFE